MNRKCMSKKNKNKIEKKTSTQQQISYQQKRVLCVLVGETIRARKQLHLSDPLIRHSRVVASVVVEQIEDEITTKLQKGEKRQNTYEQDSFGMMFLDRKQD